MMHKRGAGVNDVHITFAWLLLFPGQSSANEWDEYDRPAGVECSRNEGDQEIRRSSLGEADQSGRDRS